MVAIVVMPAEHPLPVVLATIPQYNRACGVPGLLCTSDKRHTGTRRRAYGTRQGVSPEQVVNLQRQIEVAVANGNPLHQLVVINVIETALDISVYDPLVGCPLTSAVFRLRSRTHAHADSSKAPWQPRLGRTPYDTCQKPASKIGSRMFLTRTEPRDHARSGYRGVGTSPASVAWGSSFVVRGSACAGHSSGRHGVVPGTTPYPSPRRFPLLSSRRPRRYDALC